MKPYGTFSDDFYVNLHVSTETDLPSSRDSVLHHFEQIQRRYPTMRNFYARERGEYVMEEDKDKGSYRWASVDSKRICSGYINPPDVQGAYGQHLDVLEMIPYTLSVSPLDCESLNVMFGFDFTFRGNQNEVVADALGLAPAFERLRDIEGASLLSQEPSIQFAMDDECRTQVRIAVETRTSAYHIRTREFPEEQLSAYLTARRLGSLAAGETYADAARKLIAIAEELLDHFMIGQVLQPLQQAIAAK